MKTKLTALLSGLLLTNVVSAATVVNLSEQPANYLQHSALLLSNQQNTGTRVITTSTFVDENQTAHTRIQQTYAGFPVWNATGVTHTPHARLQKNSDALASINANTTMNGKFYAGLEKDLANVRAPALSADQQNNILQQAKATYTKETHASTANSTKESVDTIVFVDDSNQAHYAYLVSFYLDDHVTGAHRPMLILDATSLQLYKMWDRVKTDVMPLTLGGGIGGNKKTGPIVYDGGVGHLAALTVSTEVVTLDDGSPATVCFLTKDDIMVEDVSYLDIAGDICKVKMGAHNNVSWISNDNNGTRWLFDEMNGGYSPSLDAYANGMIIESLYKDWYGIPVLTNKDGTAMQLVMHTHYGRSFDNAFWDGESMTFGDGGKLFYPLTSLDVAAHEISHGFTEQHSNLDASLLEMGALHESFSDMAAVAAQYYQTGDINWKLGNKITKSMDALRYIDEPTKDGRSIDNYKDINEVNDPHLAGGITNKAFYLIATTSGWDIRKAFDIMVRANMVYWTSSMKTLPEAACGVVAAATDKGYDVGDVRVAFQKVGLDTSSDTCKKMGIGS